jgi:DNA-binding MarR family transcriptional regulator
MGAQSFAGGTPQNGKSFLVLFFKKERLPSTLTRKTMTKPKRGVYWKTINPADASYRIEQSPFYRMAQVLGRYYQLMDTVLKPIDMDIPHWRVLTMLQQNPSVTISDLSRAAVMQISTMTKLMHRMSDEGLVTLRKSPTDQRVTEAALTPRGAKAVEDVRNKAAVIFEQAFATMPDDTIAHLNDGLSLIFDNLNVATPNLPASPQKSYRSEDG